ncbi:MAG TPA: hypothetical protein VLX59_02005 [Acidimicrobiales bacterium]|nr:hypothetical protein [Acidimicrobiales bacterium]
MGDQFAPHLHDHRVLRRGRKNRLGDLLVGLHHLTDAAGLNWFALVSDSCGHYWHEFGTPHERCLGGVAAAAKRDNGLPFRAAGDPLVSLRQGKPTKGRLGLWDVPDELLGGVAD